MDAGARHWTLATIKREYWRVARWIEIEDLLQDAAMHWHRVCVLYPNATDPAHRMALYKRVFINHIHDLAKRRSRFVLESYLEEVAPLGDVTGFLENVLPAQPEFGTFAVSIAKAPDHIKRLLAALATEHGRRFLARPSRVRRGGQETLNERLCRLVRVSPTEYDLVGALKEFFGQPA